MGECSCGPSSDVEWGLSLQTAANHVRPRGRSSQGWFPRERRGAHEGSFPGILLPFHSSGLTLIESWVSARAGTGNAPRRQSTSSLCSELQPRLCRVWKRLPRGTATTRLLCHLSFLGTSPPTQRLKTESHRGLHSPLIHPTPGCHPASWEPSCTLWGAQHPQPLSIRC